MNRTRFAILVAGVGAAALLVLSVSGRGYAPEAASQVRGGTPAAARLQPVGPRGGCAHCYEDLLLRAGQLELSEAQVKTIRHLASDSARKWIDMDADARKAQHELTEMLDKENIDLTEVVERVERTGKTSTELRYACVRNMIEVKEVLTTEQWVFWREASGYMPLFQLEQGPTAAHSQSHKVRDNKQLAQNRGPCCPHP
jgi:uncharacterized membrane protein